MFKKITYSIILATNLYVASNLAQASDTHSLLSADFKSRQIVKIEAGAFHFKSGQLAPIHSHKAPAIGYVLKGAIMYQVEGEEVTLLRTGDAFYEPVGQRILRFDNASPSEEAIFIDFNLQQKEEPFIVFEQPLTEDIDRRPLPTVEFGAAIASNRADIYAHNLLPGSRKVLDGKVPVIGYIDTGILELRTNGQAAKALEAGKTFYLPADDKKTILSNMSGGASAKVITFQIKTKS